MHEAHGTFVQKPVVDSRLGAELPIIAGYEILKLLGQGGMGKVYQARHLGLHRLVALKLVTSTDNEHALARFKEEVQAIASLKHSNIAQIYESGQFDGKPYYAMELVSGGTLSERLKHGPLPPRQAAELVKLLARAMQHAHEQNVLHRDLKPGNVLLEEGQPKIADFGLAKRLNIDTRLTRTGDIFGSPSYMAPEQASGVMKLTASVDVYSLGAILYECLSGRPPHMGSDPMQTLMLVLTDDPIPLRQHLRQLPRDLETICHKCLEKQPKKRYATAQALAEDLDRFIQGEPIQARPITEAERLMKWAARKPWQAVAAGLTLCLMSGLAIGFFLMQKAYHDVREANDEANKAFELSRNTLGETLQDMSFKLGNMPNAEAPALDVYRPALKLYRSLDQLRPHDASTTLEYLRTLYEYGVQQVMYYRYADANQTFSEAEKLLDSKLTIHAHDFELELYQAKFLICRGWLHRRQSQADKARPFERQAKSLLTSLEQREPKNVRLLRTSNELLQTNINDAIEEKKLDEAKLFYHMLLANQENIYKMESTNEQATMLISARKSMASFLLATRHIDEASELFDTIANSLAQLKITERDLLNLQTEVDIPRGDIARRRRIWPLAEKLFEQASAANARLREKYPLDVNYLYQQLDIRCKLAELRHDQGKIHEACEQLKQYVSEAEAIVKIHPEYQSIASHLQHYRKVLAQYQAEQQPTGKRE